MSVVQAAAAVVGTPTPSPVVIREVLTVPAQVPAAVLQLAQTVGLALAVGLVSVLHQLVAKNKLAANVQRTIVAAYSVIAAFVTAVLSGHLGVSANDINVEVTSLLVALGAAFSRYEYLYKAVVQGLSSNAPAVDAVAPSLATEVAPENPAVG